MISTEHTGTAARVIAFYLPQFHPIPENDEWWGTGFTEWTNVTKAKPLFPGHEQPVLAGELGYYDLRTPETRILQARMAREYGVEGFCYWHYWFAGKRLLERPFNEVLKTGEPDFPFCLAWANQSWTGIWHGCPDRTLIRQTYPGKEDYRAHFYEILPAFQDSRYLTIEGKPIFLVYCPEDLPDSRFFSDYWQELALKEGLKGIYFIGIVQDSEWNPIEAGFQASLVSNPNYLFVRKEARVGYKYKLSDRIYRKVLRTIDKKNLEKKYPPLPTLFSYETGIKTAWIKNDLPFDNYPCVFPNWDNTPRSGSNGRVFLGSTPELFQKHLQDALEQVNGKYGEKEKKVIFIKSWNEWAEGNYVEPDRKFGRGYLEAIARVILK